jgi:hypothetical protein
MKSESIPTSLKNLLSKLEFLSMIERGKKPCFGDMTFVSSNSWIGSWKRMFMGENRKNLLFEIEQIVEQGILAIQEYQNTNYLPIILENLSKAKIGIENLILTYSDHPNTISRLRVYILNIDIILKERNVIGGKSRDDKLYSEKSLGEKLMDNNFQYDDISSI